MNATPRRERGMVTEGRGMVTVELALGVAALVLVVAAAVGLVGVALVQGQCWDTAAEVARQAARGDRGAVDQARRDGPRGATVTLAREGELVVVTVRAEARPYGPRSAAVPLSATARVILEPGVTP